MPESIFMKLGMYVMAPEPISTAYFIHPSYQSVYLYVYVYPLTSARQRLGKKRYCGNEYIRNNRTIVGRVVFCAVRVA
jgi:hypothetical protein